MEVERKRVAREKARADAAVPPDLRTRREHQEKQMALAKAEDELKKAEDDLQAQEKALALDRRVRQVTLARAERELRELEGRLDELTLRAPRDGLVQIALNFRGDGRKFQIGDSAYVGMDVATLPDLSVLQVRARLPDVDEGAVRVGMRADCVLDAYPDVRHGGVIESITPIARPEGRDGVRHVFDVVVALDRTDPATMRPGMSVRVEVLRRRVEGAWLIPRQALRRVDGKTVARLDGLSDTPVDIEFCAEDTCALRGSPS
jgi:multidrug efflux pump subunit AcrA (membrane-fusion protein)